jgi:mycoredoxin
VTDKPAGEASQPALTMYSTPTCGPCIRLKQRLAERGIPYVDINLEGDAEASAWVMAINDGNRVVPTLRFSDGSTLTNPSLDDVIARLAELSG